MPEGLGMRLWFYLMRSSGGGAETLPVPMALPLLSPDVTQTLRRDHLTVTQEHSLSATSASTWLTIRLL